MLINRSKLRVSNQKALKSFSENSSQREIKPWAKWTVKFNNQNIDTLAFKFQGLHAEIDDNIKRTRTWSVTAIANHIKCKMKTLKILIFSKTKKKKLFNNWKILLVF